MKQRRVRLTVLIVIAITLGAGLVIVGGYTAFLLVMVELAERAPLHPERPGGAKDIAALAADLASPDTEVARGAAQALPRSGAEALPHIRRALHDPRPEVREAAAIACGKLGSRSDAPLLAAVLAKDSSRRVRAAAASALGDVRAYDQMEALMMALEDPDVAVRARANAAIIRITGVDVGFGAWDPLMKRRHVVDENLRALWPRIEPTVRNHYTRRKTRDTGKTR